MGDYVWGVDPAADWGQDLSPVYDSYSYDPGDFWENDSVWDSGWDSVFSDTQNALQGFDNSAINNDLDSMFADNEDLYAFDSGSESIGDKLLNFAGSKNGLSLIGGALVGGMNMYNRNQDKKTAQRNRDALAAERERERQFQKELEESKAKHAMERLKAQLEARGSGGGGTDRPAPGTATNTNTAIGAHKVRW